MCIATIYVYNNKFDLQNTNKITKYGVDLNCKYIS